MLKRIICKINLVVYKAVGRDGNFDKLKSGGLHEKRAATARNLGSISEFTWNTEEKSRKSVRMRPISGPARRILTSSE